MHEAVLKIKCKNPELVKKSMEPDIENTENSTTEIVPGKEFVEITVKNRKLSHMKAIINSYISIISMLNKTDKNL